MKEINSGEWWIVEGRELFVVSFYRDIESVRMDGGSQVVQYGDKMTVRCTRSTDRFGAMPPIFNVELEKFRDAEKMDPQPEEEYRAANSEE